MPPPQDTNRVIEGMPASFLCIVRKVQDRPYEPLTARKVQQASSQQAHLRPPPHVSKQAFNDFYTAINGYCGVSHPAPESMDMITYQSYQQKMQQQQQHQGGAYTGGGGVLAAPAGGDSSLMAPPQLSSAEAIEDFRLQQIRQNEKHVTHKGRICSYFHTKDGCRRGFACQFLHVPKN